MRHVAQFNALVDGAGVQIMTKEKLCYNLQNQNNSFLLILATSYNPDIKQHG